MTRVRIAAFVAIGALLAACAKTTNNPSGTPSTPGSPSPTATASPCAKSGGTTATHAGTAVGGTMLLTALRTGRQTCSDRLTFEFRQRDGRNGTPGYDIRYKSGPFYEDASGRAVSVRGSAFLRIHLEPASGTDISGASPDTTYTGPTTITPTGLRHVRQLVQSGDFEDVLTWIVGLDARRPFHVSVLRSGSRITLLIDVG